MMDKDMFVLYTIESDCDSEYCLNVCDIFDNYKKKSLYKRIKRKIKIQTKSS
jgi:hypothetical protein